MNLIASISKSLAAKLIIALVMLIIIGGGISWYALIHAGKENLINEAVKDAASYSDLIKKGIRYSMLTFNREGIQQTIYDLKSAKDIKGIKLFDSKGKIFYSSKPEEVGHQVDRTAPICQGCHVGLENPSEMFFVRKDFRLKRKKDSRRINEVHDGESILNRNLLRPQVFLASYREPSTRLHRGVVRDDNNIPAVNLADAEDRS